MHRTLACLVALAACGDSPSQSPDAGSPDAPPDVPLDAPPDAPIDAPPDTPIDPTTAPPRIDEVHTGNDFHEIRQGQTAQLVITGAHFTGATKVVLGDLPTTFIDTRDATLTVVVEVPHGFAPQALALAVTTPNGTTTLAGAIDTTEYIVAVDAAPAGGLGIHASPASLCGVEVTTAQPGDTLQIGAGSYHCDDRLVLAPGVVVRGAGRTRTELVGFGIDFPDAIDPRASVVSDLAIADASEAITTGLFGGALEVARVDLRGNNAVGISLQPDLSQPLLPSAALDDVSYDGAGTAIQGDASLTVKHSRLTGCAVAIASVDGDLHLTGTQITCTTGIRSGLALHRNFEPLAIELTDSTITASAPIVAEQASITLVRAQLLGAAGCTTGVLVADGGVTATDSRVECAGTAILGDGVSGLEDSQVVLLAHSEVIGGVNGVVLASANDPSLVSATTSHIHGGSRAAISLEDDDARADLGTPSAPGGNDLTSDTGVAFHDERDDPVPNEITEAHGTTLNGHTYDGQTIAGPATLAHDYKLGPASVLRF